MILDEDAGDLRIDRGVGRRDYVRGFSRIAIGLTRSSLLAALAILRSRQPRRRRVRGGHPAPRP